MQRQFISLSLLAALLVPPVGADMIHRWTFNSGAPGAAPSGTVVKDVIGTGHATILGSGASFTGKGVKLPGGSQGSAAYVDLPNGLISKNPKVTLEGWMSIDAGGHSWARVFDFGDSLGTELFKPGGGGEGKDYVALTAARGTNFDQQRLEFRNITGEEIPQTTLDSDITTTFGQVFYFAVTLDSDKANNVTKVHYYRDNEHVVSGDEVPWSTDQLNDVNNWLGRSNWTNDANTAGTYHDFRIYNTVLTEAQIAASRTAGPEANIPAVDVDKDGIPDDTDPLIDSDRDGMSDEFETGAGLNPNSAADGALDPDADGLTNTQEFQRGSLINKADSDDDGLPDKVESKTGAYASANDTGTDPRKADSDDDGLADKVETNTKTFVGLTNTGTDPNKADTDGDGARDFAEVLSGSDPLAGGINRIGPAHRWSFNGAKGAAANGAISPDIITGSSADAAVIRGEGSQWTGTAVKITGGSSAEGSYVDLPNGILSSQKVITLETWYTVEEATGAWGRVFDFGDSLGQELFEPGGGGEGKDYIALTASRGGEYNQQRLEFRNENPAGGGASTFDSDTETTTGKLIHTVVTIDNTKAGQSVVNYWRDGEIKTKNGNSHINLSDINDVNNWLGRSNWTNDASLNGTFDEFRVYNGVLNEATVKENFAKGPNVPPNDSDGDGIPNTTEEKYAFLNKNDASDAAKDQDADGLTNLEESRAGSDPSKVDTDGDGVRDLAEVMSKTNPALGGLNGIKPAHRWSFDNAAGPAANGATSPDSIGGAANAAVIRGAAQFTGTGVKLSGGASATAPYIDLPNQLISSRKVVTLEGWYTVDKATGAWGRVFDFGDSLGQELQAPGGGGEGKDYVALAAARGDNYNQQRLEIRNENPAGGGVATFDSDTATTVGKPIHFVVTIDNSVPGAAIYNYWRDGAQKTKDGVSKTNLSDINDVNNWLGRSNWNGDANLAGTFDEFRVYSGVINDATVKENFTKGPSALPSADDTDGDGIPDSVEEKYAFLNKNDGADAAKDQDGDGASNRDEVSRGSNLEDPDTDDDTLKDGVETKTGVYVSADNTGTDPTKADSDGDGIGDAAENNSKVFVSATNPGTNPNKADTDDDGVRDLAEALGGTNPLQGGVDAGSIAHRWSFNNAKGPAANGATSPDSLGGAADAAIIRGDAEFTGSGVKLSGGASATAPYIDLPNGLISNRQIVTLEAWYTVDSATGAWGRVFDFGDSLGNELLAPGGGGEGKDYVALTASRGDNYNQQRLEIRNENPAGGGAATFDSDTATTEGKPIHVVVTIDNSVPGTAIYNYWRDGELKTKAGVSKTNLSDIHDVNNWLGRSNWTGDANLAGTFDEFRVYTGALNEPTVKDNFAKGPNATITANPNQGGGGPPFVITRAFYDAATKAVRIVFTSSAGAAYKVESSEDLRAWTEAGTITGTANSTTFNQPLPQGLTGKRFYRVRR